MARRLTIAMVAACPFPWPRGTPIRIHRLAEGMAERGHDVHVLTYHLGGPVDGAPFSVHRIRDVPSYAYTEPGPTARKLVWLDPMLARLLRRLQRTHRFDVIHAHHYEGLLVALAAKRAAPVIYDAHTTLQAELPYYRLGFPAGWIRRAGARLDRWLPPRADHTIAVSIALRDRLVGGGLSPQAVTVIPNGVRWQRFATKRASPAGETLIFTGNLSRYQGIDLLLESFARVRARRPAARLQIVTDSTFAPFEEQAQRLGVRDGIEVRSATVDEQAVLLAEADVAVNPRVNCDGIPQKLLNYMAAGKAIASFDGSAVHLAHERTGLRVRDGDVDAMAEAVERLLRDRELAARLGGAARQQVRQEFSWEHVAARVEAVYDRHLPPARDVQA